MSSEKRPPTALPNHGATHGLLKPRRAAKAVAVASLLVGLTIVRSDVTFAAGAPPPPGATHIAATMVDTYTVKTGDTLGGIADKFGVPIDLQEAWIAQVVSLNGLTDANSVVVGQVLTLPPVPPPNSAGGQTSTRAAAGSPDSGTYTVQDGDTLLGIAAKLGIPSGQRWDWAAAVQSLNGLSDNDFLKLGQVLNLPSLDSLPTHTNDASSAPTATPEPTVMPVLPATYTVKAGDENLYDLAARFGIPSSMRDAWVTNVVRINHLDARGMYVGNVIALPKN